MAPKEVQEEEPLQAVIITDSFNNRYKPLTLDRPRVISKIVFFFFLFLNKNYIYIYIYIYIIYNFHIYLNNSIHYITSK